MFHEIILKLYFMKCLERKISQCILPFRNFTKFTGMRPATLLKKKHWHRCFPVNFVKVPMDKIKKATKHVAATLLLFSFYS